MPNATCSVDDCARQAASRGWCDMHYRRWRRHGSADVVSHRSITHPIDPVAAFWAKVDKRGPDDCWPWLGTALPNGRGKMQWNGVLTYAPRIALELDGRPPGDLHACHHCDVPACVNPGHLFVGTRSDNMRDMHAKGRRQG